MGDIRTIIDAIKPFQPDDGHKGTFIVLRVAGMEQGTALHLVNRKFRSWQNWRATDEDFRTLDDAIPELTVKYSGEARVIRTALLDIHIIETGIQVFHQILHKEAVSSDKWAFAAKLAGLRIPIMGAKEESGSPWERLANAIQTTVSQKELGMKETNLITGMERTVIAKEVTIIPSEQQRLVASGIVEQMLNKARAMERTGKEVETETSI
jgi:hypothetical protein